MKNKASFLQSIFLVALCVTSCVLLTHTGPLDLGPTLLNKEVATLLKEEIAPDDLVLSCSGFSLGFQNCTRSTQNIVSPFNKSHEDLDFELVEKCQSIVIKVSYKYLFDLQFFQTRGEYLFLDLRKLLI